eukprot:PhF_6_TR8725/c2_g1_i10/m.13710
MNLFLLSLSLFVWSCTTQNFTVTTVTGFSGTSDYVDGPPSVTKLIGPSGLTQLPNGTVLFADSAGTPPGTSLIRAMDMSTGRVWTVAGGGSGQSDGVGRSALFDLPRNIRMHSDGISVLITDMENYVIRRLVLSTGMVSTIAGVMSDPGYIDGMGSSARFKRISDVVVLRNGTVLIVDEGNCLIRGMSSGSPWNVWTVAGTTGIQGYKDGIGRDAKFSSNLEGIIQLADGTVLIADSANGRIRGLNVSTLQVWTVAGDGSVGFQDGVGTAAKFGWLCNFVEVQTSTGPIVYFTDRGNNNAIRALNMATGSVWTVIGGTSGFSDSPTPRMKGPFGILLLKNGSLLVSDYDNYAIRVLKPVYCNQDGLGYSGTFTVFKVISDPIQMISHNAWPSVTVSSGG